MSRPSIPDSIYKQPLPILYAFHGFAEYNRRAFDRTTIQLQTVNAV